MTFNVTQNRTVLDVSFSATLENIDRATQVTKQFLTRVHAERHTFDVVLVLREALTNAVMKGSQLDAEKTVTYTLRLEGHELIMEIEDEGKGFNWQNHFGKKPRPSAEAGRGLAIMTSYCEEVVFNDKGNKLILKKDIRSGKGR